MTILPTDINLSPTGSSLLDGFASNTNRQLQQYSTEFLKIVESGRKIFGIIRPKSLVPDEAKTQFRVKRKSLSTLVPIIGPKSAPFNEVAHTYYHVSQRTLCYLHIVSLLVRNPKVGSASLSDIKKTLQELRNTLTHARVRNLDRRVFESVDEYRTYRQHLTQRNPEDIIPFVPDILGPMISRVEEVMTSIIFRYELKSKVVHRGQILGGSLFFNAPPLEEYFGDESYFQSLLPLNTEGAPKVLYFSNLKKPPMKLLSSSQTVLQSTFLEEGDFEVQADKDFRRRESTVRVRASLDGSEPASSSEPILSCGYVEHIFDLATIMEKMKASEGEIPHEIDQLMGREEKEAFLKLSTQMSQAEMFEMLKNHYGIGEHMDAKLVVTGSNIRGLDHPSDKIVLYQEDEGEWLMKRLRRYYVIDAERRVLEEIEEKEALVFIIDAQEIFNLTSPTKPIKLRWREVMPLPIS